MKKEYRKFYNVVVENFINENIGDNKDLVTELKEYSDVLQDDIVEFIDNQIYQILVNQLNMDI